MVVVNFIVFFLSHIARSPKEKKMRNRCKIFEPNNTDSFDNLRKADDK